MVNGFGTQTQALVVSDVVTVDIVATLSEVEENYGLVIVGLQEEDVIELEMEQQFEEDCNSGVLTTVTNQGMLEQPALVYLLVSAGMVT